MAGRLLCVLALVAAVLQLVLADEFKKEYDAYNKAKFGYYPSNKHKATKTKSPVLQVTTWDKKAQSKSGSHIFIRHNGAQEVWGHQDASPLILDAHDLTAVYVNRSFPIVFNVRVQENYGKKYLTFYGDKLVDFGLGSGICHAYDTSYREVYRIAPQNLKVKADLHECEFTGNGTVIVSAYELGRSSAPPQLKATSKQTYIYEGIFQEIDLETKKALFTWRASEHVDIYDSFEGHSSKWDFFHINTVEKTEDGNYLISARHMHSIYLINGQTGDIMWTLGGAKNEFVELPPEDGVYSSNPVLTFAWQHHSRFYKGGTGGKLELTFFDNHLKDHNEVACKKNCSRGLHVRLDTTSNPKTVQLVREYQHPAGILSQSQGSMQILDNGNAFIGWGKMPGITEHTPDGKAVLDIQFSPWWSKTTKNHGLDNYRAFKQDWRAMPHWPPTIATTSNSGAVTAYVSWNGATDVKEWVFFTGDSDVKKADRAMARVPRSGFETEVTLGHLDGLYLRAEAMDKHNRVLGSTGVLNLESGKIVSMDMAVSNVLDEIIADEDDEISGADPIIWDFSKEGREWQIAQKLVAILGAVLSVCCLIYALVLRLRLDCKAQVYSAL